MSGSNTPGLFAALRRYAELLDASDQVFAALAAAVFAQLVPWFVIAHGASLV